VFIKLRRIDNGFGIDECFEGRADVLLRWFVYLLQEPLVVDISFDLSFDVTDEIQLSSKSIFIQR